MFLKNFVLRMKVASALEGSKRCSKGVSVNTRWPGWRHLPGLPFCGTFSDVIFLYFKQGCYIGQTVWTALVKGVIVPTV